MTNTTQSPHLTTEGMPREELQLLAKIQRVLEASGYPEIQQISVKVGPTEISLHGRVSSFFQKQLAQELVKRIPHLPSLRNEILVAAK